MEDNEYKKMIMHRIFSILKKNDIYDIIINKLSEVTNPRYHNYIGLYDLMFKILSCYKGHCFSQPKMSSYFFPFIYLVHINEIIERGDIDNFYDIVNNSFWEDDILYKWYIEHVKKY